MKKLLFLTAILAVFIVNSSFSMDAFSELEVLAATTQAHSTRGQDAVDAVTCTFKTARESVVSGGSNLHHFSRYTTSCEKALRKTDVAARSLGQVLDYATFASYYKKWKRASGQSTNKTTKKKTKKKSSEQRSVAELLVEIRSDFEKGQAVIESLASAGRVDDVQIVLEYMAEIYKQKAAERRAARKALKAKLNALSKEQESLKESLTLIQG